MSSAGRRGRQRVLVLTGIFPNRSNPTWGVHVFQNVRALSAEADVRVVATVPWVPKVIARGRYKHHVGVPARETWEGIDTVYPRFFVVPRVARFLHGWEYFYSIRSAVSREIESFHPDVILAYFAYPYGFAAVQFGKIFKLPVVISCRGSDINLMATPKLQKGMIVSALRGCQRVFVMSDEMQKRVLSFGLDPKRVEVVSNGVDAERFKPMDRKQAREALGVPTDARVLVCVSRLSKEKGIDILVDAMAKLKDDSRLYVIGDGLEHAALTARALSAGVAARITFARARPHSEIPQWIAAADISVLPSRSEGMPNAVLEALACGRPVVATAVGGTQELIDNAALGILVPPGDSGALAHALHTALNDTWNEKVIAASVAERTWDAVGKRAARLLEFDHTQSAAAARGISWTAGSQ